MNIVIERGFDILSERARPPGPTETVPTELAVRGLRVCYGKQAAVFSDVTFAVRRGESVALVGANGAGKSTLLKCLLGFVHPSLGDVALFGQPICALPHGAQRRLRRHVGFVAQKHNLVGRLSVLSNVVHGMLAARPGPCSWVQAFAPRAVRAHALHALDRVGLADLAPRRADSLSGGQSQRVAIARALVAEPRLILADEPAASLDPAAGEEVMQVFSQVVRDSGVTLVFTTHHIAHATSYARRVIGLREGRLAMDTLSDRIAPRGLSELYE